MNSLFNLSSPSIGAKYSSVLSEKGTRMHNNTRITALACAIAVLLGSHRIVLAQAGSTGGVIGKSDKSISGVDDLGEPRGRTSPTNKKAGHVATSLSGRWDWEAGCAVSRYFGDFQLTELSGGQLAGEFIRDSGAVQGGQIRGSVHGSEVSFLRDNGESKLRYNLVLDSSRKMHGSASYAGAGFGCTFTATKR
jgi:hypothetical protein